MTTNHEKAIAVGSSDRRAKTFSEHHSNSGVQITPQQLLVDLDCLPDDWALVAVRDNKAPIGNNWQDMPLAKQDFQTAVQTGRFDCLTVGKEKEAFHPPVSWFHAVGVICGTPSGGLLFLDHDGTSCDPLIEQLSRQSLEEALPKTVSVTSGREGRYQLIYRVPERYWGAIATQKIKTGAIGEDRKPELLEFRWDGCQSVVTGYHPITGAYKWSPGLSPTEYSIAEAPAWMIEQMWMTSRLVRQASQTHPRAQTRNLLQMTERDWALSYLNAIPSAEDYDTWIQVGIALHSVSDDLWLEWDRWSQGATNYEPEACAQHWRTFKNGGRIGIGTLGFLAKQNDWQSPIARSGSDRSIHAPEVARRNEQPDIALAESLEDAEELAEEVQTLVKLTEEVAPVQSLLSPRLTIPLTHLANQFNVPLEAFIGVLLAVAASLLRVNTCIEIDAHTGFRPPAILWMGLVGESGTTKSPIFNSLLEPLEKLQTDADAAHELAIKDYKNELQKWQERPKDERRDAPTEPHAREYYLQDATMEALADCLSKQPDRGIAIAIDELAGLFTAFNQYRAHGRGNDRQKWLSAYDGKPIKVNRKTGPRISVPRTAISLAGTIQPCVLQKHMGNLSETDGFWARFLWVPLPLTEMPSPGEGPTYGLSGLLQTLYKALENLYPKTYQLDCKGRQIWKTWHCFCEKQKVSEPNAALRAIYPKSKERAARIALVIHCINAAIEDRTPEQIIPSALLESAIAFTKWSIGQSRLIYAAAGAVSYGETPRIVRFVDKFRDHEWITARNVIHWWSGKPKIKAEAAREFMKQVVDLGHAIDNGATGKTYAIQIKRNDENSGNNCSQCLAASDPKSGNNRGNSSVTINNNTAGTSKKQSCEIGSDVTIQCVSLKGAGSKDSNEFFAELLPDVAGFVTPLNAAPVVGSTGICYSVTDTKLQFGDRVVLSGEGNCRPSVELKASWTVKTIQGKKAIVECETLGSRVFPLEWLALYEQKTE